MSDLLSREWRELRKPVLVGVVVYVAIAAFDLLRPDHWRPSATIGWAFAVPAMALMLGCYSLCRDGADETEDSRGNRRCQRARVWAVKLLAGLTILVVAEALTTVSTILIQPDYDEFAPQADSRYAIAVIVGLQAGVTFFAFALGFLMSGIVRGPYRAFGAAVGAAAVIAEAWVFLTGDLLPRFCGPNLGIVFPSTALPLTAATAAVLGAALLACSGWSFVSAAPVSHRHRRRTVWLALAATVVVIPAMIWLWVFGCPPRFDPHLAEALGEVSPDGRWVTVGCRNPLPWFDRYSRNWEDWALRTDGSGAKRIARGPGASQWLPDSRHAIVRWGSMSTIPFIGSGNPPSDRLWLVDTETGKSSSVGPTEEFHRRCDLSPQGTYVATARSVYALDPPRRLPGVSIPESARDLAWSADERELCYRYSPDGGPQGCLAGVQIPSGEPVAGLRTDVLGDLDQNSHFSIPAGQCTWGIIEMGGRFAPSGTPQPWPARSTLVRLKRTDRVAFDGALLGRGFSPDLRYCWLAQKGAVAVVDLSLRRVIRRIELHSLVGDPERVSLHWSAGGRMSILEGWSGPPASEGTAPGHRLFTVASDGSDLRPLGTLPPRTYLVGRRPWTDDGALVTIARSGQRARLLRFDPHTGQTTDLLVVSEEEREELSP